MKSYIGVGLSVGLLAGLWTQISVELGLITWIAFIAWACFFAAGGGATGFSRTLASNLTGVAYGWLAGLMAAVLNFPGALALGVGIVALAMCLQAGWSPLSFIPGAFAGTAAYFGSTLLLGPTILALLIGAGLGWLSAILGTRLQTLFTKPAVANAPEVGIRPAAVTKDQPQRCADL